MKPNMSLEEAIEHCDEIAANCGPCAEQHRQLASWLRELQLQRLEKTTCKITKDIERCVRIFDHLCCAA